MNLKIAQVQMNWRAIMMFEFIIVFGLSMIGLQFIPALYDHIKDWNTHRKMIPCVDFEDW